MCNSSDPFGLLTPAQLARLAKIITLGYAFASSILDGAHIKVSPNLEGLQEWAQAIDPEKIKTSKDLAQAATDEARLLRSGPTAKIAPAIGDAAASGAEESVAGDVLSIGSRIVLGTAAIPIAVVTAVVTVALGPSNLNNDQTTAAWIKAHPTTPKKNP